MQTASALVHAFISSWIDFGNPICSGLDCSLTWKSQSVVNSSTYLIDGIPKFGFVSAYIQCIEFKILTFMCISASSVRGRKSLRSFNETSLCWTRSGTDEVFLEVTFYKISFILCMLSTWQGNQLPVSAYQYSDFWWCVAWWWNHFAFTKGCPLVQRFIIVESHFAS